MSNKKNETRVINEGDFRLLSFAYHGTIISGRCQEIDVFRPAGGDPPCEVEIRVTMALRDGGGMTYDSLALTSFQGAPIIMAGPRGNRKDIQMAEVIIWEAIEGEDRAFDYYYGRVPLGEGLKPGSFVEAKAAPDPTPDLA